MPRLPSRSAQPKRPGDVLRRSLVVSGLLALSVPGAWAQPASKPSRSLPEELEAFASTAAPWRLQGNGALRFFGFKAYDAYLWTQGGTDNPLQGTQPYALEIEYSTSLRAEEIVNVSILEMGRLRRPSDDQLKAWNQAMQRAFPSVKAGDRLLGVQVPGKGTRLFFNGRLTADIADPSFGEAFFAIWLDAKTKRPDLRRDLLGPQPPVPKPEAGKA
jgi:hypothetical protein